jgi:peptidyl-prolyl cis-trans isomerase D
LDEKKYNFFIKKHKLNIDIESLSKDYDIDLERASAVTQYDPILVGAGSEPYIIGSAFSLDTDETSNILKGNGGIYLVRLISKDTAEDINLAAAISNSLGDREIERISTLIPEVLESKAEIIDNRSLYY